MSLLILRREDFDEAGKFRDFLRFEAMLISETVVFADGGRLVVLKHRHGGEWGTVHPQRELVTLAATNRIHAAPLSRLDGRALHGWERRGLSCLLQALWQAPPTVGAAEVPRPAESSSSATHAPAPSTHQGQFVPGSIQGQTDSKSQQGSSADVAGLNFVGKGGVEDLRKARHYLDKLIQVLDAGTKAEVPA